MNSHWPRYFLDVNWHGGHFPHPAAARSLPAPAACGTANTGAVTGYQHVPTKYGYILGPRIYRYDGMMMRMNTGWLFQIFWLAGAICELTKPKWQIPLGWNHQSAIAVTVWRSWQSAEAVRMIVPLHKMQQPHARYGMLLLPNFAKRSKDVLFEETKCWVNYPPTCRTRYEFL